MSSKNTVKDRYITDKVVELCNILLNANTDDEIVGYIQVPNKGSLRCDFNVIVMLKTILKVGITPNEQLAAACRQMFKEIISSDKEYISQNKAFAAITTESYEAKQLCNGLKEVFSG